MKVISSIERIWKIIRRDYWGQILGLEKSMVRVDPEQRVMEA